MTTVIGIPLLCREMYAFNGKPQSEANSYHKPAIYEINGSTDLKALRRLNLDGCTLQFGGRYSLKDLRGVDFSGAVVMLNGEPISPSILARPRRSHSPLYVDRNQLSANPTPLCNDRHLPGSQDSLNEPTTHSSPSPLPTSSAQHSPPPQTLTHSPHPQNSNQPTTILPLSSPLTNIRHLAKLSELIVQSRLAYIIAKQTMESELSEYGMPLSGTVKRVNSLEEKLTRRLERRRDILRDGGRLRGWFKGTERIGSGIRSEWKKHAEVVENEDGEAETEVHHQNDPVKTNNTEQTPIPTLPNHVPPPAPGPEEQQQQQPRPPSAFKEPPAVDESNNIKAVEPTGQEGPENEIPIARPSLKEIYYSPKQQRRPKPRAGMIDVETMLDI